MAGTITVAESYSRGAVSDVSRAQLPKDAVYRLTDYIPDNGAPARKRGGWGYGSNDLNGLSATARGAGLGWAPFAGDPHLVALGETGKLYQIKSFPGGSFLGTTHGQSVTHRPFWHIDRMIIPAQLGASAANPYKLTYDGVSVYTIAAVGGTPPQARVGCSWGDYLLLANYYDPSDSNKLKNYRLAWSGPGAPDTWALSGTSASTEDMDGEVLAVMLIRNITLVWGYSNVWVITGDTPPPGGNLDVKTLFAYGTFDGRSVAQYKEYAIWANNSGVFKTDGATLTDLTGKGGYTQRYRDVVSGFDFAEGWSAAGGVLYGCYFLTITDNNGVVQTTFVCDIDRQIWFEFDNFDAAMYAGRVSGSGTATVDGHEELFFVHRNIARVGMVAQCWTPGPTNRSDADGSAVLPEIEYGYYKLGDPSLKRVRKVFVSYDLRDTGGNSPSLQVSKVTSPEATSYEALTPTLDATTALTRASADVGEKVNGIAFKITQTNPSDDTSLYEVELEGHGMEQSRK